MNKKYLFGMLVSGAMLAACTADDLNVAPVAQEVNPSAPVFTVSFDGDDYQNRAEWLGAEGNWAIRLTGTDVMSLYHGITLDGTLADKATKDDSLKIKSCDNAIYKGTQGDDGSLTFTTPSMVKEGLAVLVFPADTTFFGGAFGSDREPGYLTVKVPVDQNKKTKESTPYMSEVLTISPRVEGDKVTGKDNSAGYDRKYDVVLKRAASSLSLTLDLQGNFNKPEGVADLKLEEVTLGTAQTESNNNKTPFAEEVYVMVSNAESKGRKKIAGTTDKFEHDAWKNQSVLNTEPKKYTDHISTTDIETVGDKQVATFTLLPSEKMKSAKQGIVTILTNYGKIEVKGTHAVDNAYWHGSETLIPEGMTGAGDAKNKAGSTSVAGGYQAIAKYLWAISTATGPNAFYNGERVGYHINSSLDIDETNLVMDGLHIKNKQHLQDAIKVFDELYGNGDAKGEPVVATFLLDGEASGANKEKFVMDETTWNAVTARLAKNAIPGTKSVLNFAPCQDNGEICKNILLDNADVETKVPALQFATQQDKTLNLELKGKNWKYESNASGASALNIQGIAEIHVTAQADLTPKGYIAVRGTQEGTGSSAKYPTSLKLVVDKDGELKINSEVRVQVDVDNYGTITIAKEGGDLRIDQDQKGQGKKLINQAQAQKVTNNKTTVTGLNRECGVINNSGNLGVVSVNGSNKGEIHNYGEIWILEPTAETAVTTNQKEDADFTATYGGDEDKDDENIFGTINLNSVTGGGITKIYDEDMMGFVKYTIDTPTPEYKDFGGDKCMANYIVLGPKCTKLIYADDGKQTPALTNLPKDIEYIEVQGKVVFENELDEEYSLTGLILKDAAARFTVARGAKLSVECFYLKGKVSIFGELTGNQVVGYLGGAAADAENFSDSGTTGQN